MSGITISYCGLSEETLTSSQVIDIFDRLWGEPNRAFPRFPKVIGGISAFWRSADANKHHVSSIAELIEAYEQQLTYDIHISGAVDNNPRCTFVYIPAKKEGFIQVTATTNELVEEKLKVVKEMCPKQEKPVVFISYANKELALADFIKKVLKRIAGDHLEIFIANRDIPPGDNPLKVMMEEKLKLAQAIIPICSYLAKTSSWVSWESAAVWARGYKVYPLCSNISLGDFGAPLSLVTQGRGLFVQDEFLETLKSLCNQFNLSDGGIRLNEEEKEELNKLKDEYSKRETSAGIEASYDTLNRTQELHKYSFLFDVENKTDMAFQNIVVELIFPEEYLEKKEWNYPHLTASESEEMPGHLCFLFDYSALSEAGKKQFSTFLLPQKKYEYSVRVA